MRLRHLGFVSLCLPDTSAAAAQSEACVESRSLSNIMRTGHKPTQPCLICSNHYSSLNGKTKISNLPCVHKVYNKHLHETMLNRSSLSVIRFAFSLFYCQFAAKWARRDDGLAT